MRDELLSILEKNSRIAFSELAVLLGTTEEQTLKEIEALEKEGVISGYHTLINWEKTNIEKVTALIEMPFTVAFNNLAGVIICPSVNAQKISVTSTTQKAIIISFNLFTSS